MIPQIMEMPNGGGQNLELSIVAFAMSAPMQFDGALLQNRTQVAQFNIDGIKAIVAGMI